MVTFLPLFVQYYSVICRPSDPTVWGGPGPRFAPGTGGQDAGTITTRPPHLINLICFLLSYCKNRTFAFLCAMCILGTLRTNKIPKIFGYFFLLYFCLSLSSRYEKFRSEQQNFPSEYLISEINLAWAMWSEHVEGSTYLKEQSHEIQMG